MIRGSTIAQQPYKEQYSPSKGGIETYTWQGTYANITNLIPNLVNQGYEYTLQEMGKGGLWELQATIGADRPVYSWELFFDKVEKPVLYSNVPEVLALDKNNLAILDYSEKHVEDLRGKTPQPSGSLSPANLTTFNNLWVHFLNGFKSIESEIPVVKRSYIVNSNYQLLESVSNIDKVYSKGSFIAIEGVPWNLWALLPDSSVDTTDATLTKLWGYKKGSPTIELVSNNRWQVSQSWTYNAWSQFIYKTLL